MLLAYFAEAPVSPVVTEHVCYLTQQVDTQLLAPLVGLVNYFFRWFS